MQAGELTERVGFYCRGEKTDSPDYGRTKTPFRDLPEFEARANIKPRLGGEEVLAGRLTGKNLVNVTVRQSTAMRRVDVSWKLRDMRSGVEYNIRSVIDPYRGDSNRGRFFEFLCEAGGAL